MGNRAISCWLQLASGWEPAALFLQFPILHCHITRNPLHFTRNSVYSANSFVHSGHPGDRYRIIAILYAVLLSYFSPPMVPLWVLVKLLLLQGQINKVVVVCSWLKMFPYYLSHSHVIQDTHCQHTMLPRSMIMESDGHLSCAQCLPNAFYEALQSRGSGCHQPFT